MPIELEQRPILSVGDTDIGSIDYQDYLDSGELLTGTPTVVEVTSSDLTLGNKAVSTAALTIRGRTSAIGQAVQFSVLGQAAGTKYRIRVTATTTSTPARVKVVDATFRTATAGT